MSPGKPNQELRRDLQHTLTALRIKPASAGFFMPDCERLKAG